MHDSTLPRGIAIVGGLVAVLLSATPAFALTVRVPEPSSLTLVAAGAAGFAIWGARKFLKKRKK